MSAYVIFRATVTDPEAYRRYGEQARPSLPKYGVQVLAAGSRGEQFQVLEGEWGLRASLLRFENVEAARRWYYSEEYQAAIKLREGGAKVDLIVIDDATMT